MDPPGLTPWGVFACHNGVMHLIRKQRSSVVRDNDGRVKAKIVESGDGRSVEVFPKTVRVKGTVKDDG